MTKPLIALFSLLFILAGTPALHAEPVFLPGQRIGLEPPKDATPSQRFPGFEDTDRKVAIALVDMPYAAYDSVLASLFNKKDEVEDSKRESFPFDAGIGILATGRVKAPDGTPVYKYLMLSRTIAGPAFNLTALVNVEVPESARATYTDEAVRAMLRTIVFRAVPAEEQLSMLPFRLTEMAGFRLLQTVENGVILTDGPGEDLNIQPSLIINAAGGDAPDPRDRERFAREMLQAAPVRELNVLSAEPLRIANGPGFEIRARAVSLTGNPVSLVQWVRFGTSGYMRILGVTHPSIWNDVFPRFRAVRDGIAGR